MTVTENCPVVLWAQRADKVMLSIQLDDVTEEQINVDANSLTFKGTSGGKNYVLKLEFNSGIIPEDSKQKKGGREYYFELKKSDPGPFWPRLIKDKGKTQHIKIDFNRWKDEDESEDEQMGGGGGMGGGGNKYDDASLEDMMQQMGTGGGGPDFDPDEGCSEDSDDDDLPQLESDAKVNGEAAAAVVNGDS